MLPYVTYHTYISRNLSANEAFQQPSQRFTIKQTNHQRRLPLTSMAVKRKSFTVFWYVVIMIMFCQRLFDCQLPTEFKKNSLFQNQRFN